MALFLEGIGVDRWSNIFKILLGILTLFPAAKNATESLKLSLKYSVPP